MSKRKAHPGTLIRRGDAYWWRWMVGGRRFSRTFKTHDRGEALRMLRAAIPEVEAEAERMRRGIRAGLTIGDVFDEWERDYLPGVSAGTRDAYRDSLKPFRRFFVERRGNPPVAAIDRGGISAYVAWRRADRRKGKAPLSQRTLRKDHAVLHTIFAWASDERGYRPDNPVTKKGKPKKGDARQPIVLTDAQVEALAGACEGRPMLRLFVVLCHETGVRPTSEALWLRWDDIDLAAGMLRIVSGRDGHRTKTGRTRSVPISGRLATALREHMAAHRLTSGSPWVFHHVRTRRNAKAGQRVGGMLHGFQRAAERAKLPAGVVPYDLRHTRLTKWAAAGHNLAVVQKAAGHASIGTTMGYLHLADSVLRALVAPPIPEARAKSG